MASRPSPHSGLVTMWTELARARLPVVVAALLWADLLGACQCEPSRTTASGAAGAAVRASQEEREHFAKPAGACGLTLLEIATSESGPFESVYQAGPQAPSQRLRPHAWSPGGFMVRGRMTGRQRGNAECGRYPEFEVLSFRPWGPVRRCMSPGALDTSMLLYTEELPEEYYVQEDFVGGPELPMVDDESCRATESCQQGERRVVACAGQVLCCRLLPPLKQ